MLNITTYNKRAHLLHLIIPVSKPGVFISLVYTHSFKYKIRTWAIEKVSVRIF